MILLLCITVICFCLMFLSTKKPYSRDDMLWALYVTGKEKRVKDNASN